MTDQEEPWIEDGDNKHNHDEDDDDYGGGNSLFEDPRGEFELDFEQGISVCLMGIKAKYPMFLQSTGLTLWQSSKNLCTYLIANSQLVQKKKIVELGAGLGLAGIVASKLGASKVVLTDGDTDTLENMRENVNMNKKTDNNNNHDDDDVQGVMICRQLRWGRNVEEFRKEYTQDEGFDIVMVRKGDTMYFL